MSEWTDVDELLTEVRNEWPEYLHDIGRCEDDCPFCQPSKGEETG